MSSHVRPARAFTLSWICSLPQQRNHAQFLHERRVEGNFVEAVQNISCRLRCLPALLWIDLDQDGIMRVALSDQRRNGGIPCEAAVPIRFALDLDSLEHCGKARRGQKHLGSYLAVAKDSSAAGVHVCGGDKKLDRRCYEALEIDTFGQYLAKGVKTRGVEVVRREYARDQIDGEVGGRCVERPAAHQPVQGSALQGAEGGST